jgi:hypothetical protein
MKGINSYDQVRWNVSDITEETENLPVISIHRSVESVDIHMHIYFDIDLSINERSTGISTYGYVYQPIEEHACILYIHRSILIVDISICFYSRYINCRYVTIYLDCRIDISRQ